jgi:hypothetical protein
MKNIDYGKFDNGKKELVKKRIKVEMNKKN